MSGVSAAASVPVGPFPSCVPFTFLVLFVMAAPWAGPAGPVGLGRPDSRASQGAAATHSSNSTASGTSPPGLNYSARSYPKTLSMLPLLVGPLWLSPRWRNLHMSRDPDSDGRLADVRCEF